MDARLFHIFGTEEKTKELAKMDNINQKDLAIQKSFLDVVAGIMWGPACLVLVLHVYTSNKLLDATLAQAVI